MKSTKFITELRARGLQITEKEAEHLMEIAVYYSYCMGLRKEQLNKKQND